MEIPESVQQVLAMSVRTYPIEEFAVRATAMGSHAFSKMRLDIAEARSLYWISLVHFDATPPKLQARIKEQGITIYELSKTAGQLIQSG